jgi:hypothetical protein
MALYAWIKNLNSILISLLYEIAQYTRKIDLIEIYVIVIWKYIDYLIKLETVPLKIAHDVITTHTADTMQYG